MDFELIRTCRKTVAIYIKDCRVIVRAPMRYPARDIGRFVESKKGWIEKHLAEQQERAERRAELPAPDKKQIRLYKEQASKIIPERIILFAHPMGVRPSDIRIGSAKKSWGSCSSSGRLTFSWRLMMAPPEAIDYVVVHELAHLKQLNHSKAFWKIVEEVMPDWKKRRRELKLLQNLIPF